MATVSARVDAPAVSSTGRTDVKYRQLFTPNTFFFFFFTTNTIIHMNLIHFDCLLACSCLCGVRFLLLPKVYIYGKVYIILCYYFRIWSTVLSLLLITQILVKKYIFF